MRAGFGKATMTGSKKSGVHLRVPGELHEGLAADNVSAVMLPDVVVEVASSAAIM